MDETWSRDASWWGWLTLPTRRQTLLAYPVAADKELIPRSTSSSSTDWVCSAGIPPSLYTYLIAFTSGAVNVDIRLHVYMHSYLPYYLVYLRHLRSILNSYSTYVRAHNLHIILHNTAFMRAIEPRILPRTYFPIIIYVSTYLPNVCIFLQG
jgi:hypothetical protein